MASVSLGIDTATGQPVSLDDGHRQSGLYIIGKPGMGKTTLIENLVIQDIEAGHGVCVLDPSGDLVRRVIRRIPKGREADVVLLDATDHAYPFALNPFDCGEGDPSDPLLVNRIQGQFVDIFRKMWGEGGSQGTSWGPRLEDLLRSIALTFIENPPYTMAEIGMLLTDEQFRNGLVVNVTNDEVRRFWTEFGGLRGQGLNQEISSTMNKVRAFLTQPVIKNIVGQSRTTADFSAFMDARKLVLVPLPVGKLGPEAAQLIGSLMVLEILNAALAREGRRSEEMPRFYLYADEYQRFATEAFATLIEEARKYEVSVTIAHQHRMQLDIRNRTASLMAGSLVIFNVEGNDAEDLAKQFDNTPTPVPVPARRPTPEPLDHIIERGIKDATANKIAELFRAVRERTREPIDARDPDKRDYLKKLQFSQKQALLRMNALLCQQMEEGPQAGSRPHSSEIAWIAWLLQEHWLKPGVPGPLWPHQMRNFIVLDEMDVPTDIFRALQDVALAPRQSVEERNERLKTLAVSLEAHPYRRYIPEHAEQFEALMLGLFYLGQAVAQDPILVDTGQYEMGLEKRPYADMQAEMANRLANFGRFQAEAKILRGENPLVVEYEQFEIRTAVPAIGGNREDEEASFDAIRERSRADYGKVRLLVEDEVHIRQGQPPSEDRPRRMVRLDVVELTTPQSMYCLLCGRELAIDARFCLYCGAATDPSVRQES